MTKNTTKRKRRKNLKLRRTIRKTVAALIMIMAVIVAGLPVENLGTMRAQNASAVNISVQDLYTEYANSMETTHKDKENELVEDGGVPDATKYNKDDWDKKTIRIEEDSPGTATINWEYKMKDRADGTYVIVDHNENGGFGDNVVIDQVMNTEYFVITNDMFQKAIAIFESDEYVARFAKTGESTVYQVPDTDITYTNLPIISTTDYDEGESIYKEGSFESEINGENRTFMIRRHSESFNIEMLRKYSTKFSDLWNAKIAKINEYNSLVDSLVKRIEVSDGNELDKKWMDETKAKIDSLRPECEKFETKYTVIATTELEKICLINRLSYQHKTYNISMDGFEMLTVGSRSDAEFNAKYIPRWVNKGYGQTPSEDCNSYDYKINGVVSDRAQFLNDKGYIWLDYLETSGIGNNAFEDEKISSVSFPDVVSFNFIGNDAFKKCDQLTAIDLTGIKTIGNRAFYECTNLTNVKFVDDENNVGTTVVLGAEAFRKTKVANITFPITLEVIGRGCFAESDIQRFLIQKDTRNDVTIWPFAFYDCKSLIDIDDTFFPKDMIKGVRLGMGAFAVSSDGNSAMTSFTFPHVMEKIIAESNVDEDEFFLKDAVEKVFTDKGRNHPITAETYYDYILAGRSNNLKKVTFPYKMGNDDKNNKIPDNTLRGCKNLECVVFGELCLNNSNTYTTYDVLAPDGANVKEYDTDDDGEVLFSDITNDKFYVEGPGFAYRSVSESSEPRRVTAKAQTKASSSIPYIFLVEDNPPKEQIEMSYGSNHSCLAVMEVVSENTTPKEVKLVKYVDNSIGDEMIDDLVIESMIGNYKLVGLGEDCFKDVKNKVIEFTIKDGSISDIEKNAFSGSTSLQRVNIGNSVTTIGESAFAGCSKLENVYFSSLLNNRNINAESDASEWAKQLSIGTDAFKTGSSFLTFHGDIHSGYAPYELAMSTVAGKPYEFGNSGRTICYKTDAPQHLTVIYDFQTGKSTLIDYPHYEEIDILNAKDKEIFAENKEILDEDYSIKGNFEKYNGFVTSYDQIAKEPETDESAIIAATYNIELPDGIESIDVKNYITYSKNKPNVDYLYLSYEEEEDGSYNAGKDGITIRKLNGGTGELKELYSNDNAGSGSDVTKAGLFSGYFKEEGTGIVPEYNSTKEYLGKTMHREDITSGNDQLLEITLNTIEELPDYAFESCENLNSVGFGTKLAELGVAPFRGCGNLTNVNTVKNPYFTCETGIIYHNPDDLRADEDLGTGYVIEECLLARGSSMGYKSINSTTDSLLSQVTGVKQEAFSHCPNIQTVDLSDTQISNIPKECFRASSSLMEVVLPETVTNIGEKAFSETTAKVTIYSTNCQIESNAFDEGCGIIRGYKYADGTNTKYSTVYQYAQNHNIPFEEIDAKYTLRFLDFDGSAIETQLVDAGKDGKEPNWKPTRTGYNFKEWSWEKTESDGKLSIVTGDAVYRNVTENRTILATYTVGNGIVSDGEEYELSIEGGKNIAGETTMKIKGGTAVSIIADEKSGSTFQYWSESTGKWSELFEDIHSDVTTFVMPNEKITITAHYADGSTGSGSGSGSGNGNGSGSGNGTGTTETKYKLTVNYGSGTGEYKAGEVVSISAFAPESSSKIFSKWTSTNTGVGFASATSATTTITMPASAVTVTANYKTRTADEDDDSELEALNKRKPTSTTTTVTTGTNNATVTTTTGTVTNTTTTTTTPVGDRITINKGGMSNTGVASTQVEGAADNFVVKVTDSAASVTEAETALKNKFGSLDGILYFPMDISLYDATGKNVIADSTGLDVTVTLPIPDELIQYGGNVRVAAIENGQLQDLNVRFTTIDGIACMSFVPPHFSPYVIYVDTNNLTAGQMLDATPKTGDPIHPKWFLAIGMACLSVILFTTGDKKKKIKMA